MPFGLSTREDPGILNLRESERLTALERIVMLVIIGGLVLLDFFGLLTTPDVDVLMSVLSIATTAVFLLFLWAPAIAAILLGVVFGVSYLTGTESAVLLAAAVAVGVVLRLGRLSLILVYMAGFLLAAALVNYGDPAVPVNVGIYLVIAIVAGAIGLALRFAFARGRRLESELAEQAEREREAVLAERRWIAGELHDSIAHHLTIVALHVQMLDDPSASRASQDAIRVAARKAMADLRFVIDLADDGPRAAGPQTGDLAAAIAEASSEIEAAGHVVHFDGDPQDQRIPRIAEIIFARIMRESATNILKYAARGTVDIRLDVDDDHAGLLIRSPLPSSPRQGLSSSGTGLNRMAERVIGASGEFSAGADGAVWQVSARLPIG